MELVYSDSTMNNLFLDGWRYLDIDIYKKIIQYFIIRSIRGIFFGKKQNIF